MRNWLRVAVAVGVALGSTLVASPAALATWKCNNWYYGGYACQGINDPGYNEHLSAKLVESLHTSRAVYDYVVCDYDSYFWLDSPSGPDRFYHVNKHYGCSGPRAWFGWHGTNVWMPVGTQGRAYWEDTNTGGFREITTQEIK